MVLKKHMCNVPLDHVRATVAVRDWLCFGDVVASCRRNNEENWRGSNTYPNIPRPTLEVYHTTYRNDDASSSNQPKRYR